MTGSRRWELLFKRDDLAVSEVREVTAAGAGGGGGGPPGGGAARATKKRAGARGGGGADHEQGAVGGGGRRPADELLERVPRSGSGTGPTSGVGVRPGHPVEPSRLRDRRPVLRLPAVVEPPRGAAGAGLARVPGR